VNLDDCWQERRDEAGNIVPDYKKFPSGVKVAGFCFVLMHHLWDPKGPLW